MMSAFAAYVPGPSALLGLAAVLFLSASFVGLGRLSGGRDTTAETALLAGWGGAVIAAKLLGVLTVAPLTVVLVGVVGFGIVGLFLLYRDGSTLPGMFRILVIGFPVLLIVAAASASQWDEFAHWLVNQRYLVDVGTFPRRGLPENHTIFAAYPYGLPLVGFFVSRLSGFFVENAGALFNSVLILVLGSAAVRAFHDDGGMPLSWSGAAWAFLAATLLNPTFVPKLVFTTYADWPTAVVLGIAVLNAAIMAGLMATDHERARRVAIQVGLILAILISLKQPNAVLALLLVAAIVVVTMMEPEFRLRHLALLAWILGPPVLVFVAWRYHVESHLPGREFSFMPLSAWLWGDLGALLRRMALIASKKGGYFGLMLVAVAVGIVAVVGRFRDRSQSLTGRLAILSTILFLGYNSFLYIAYIGAFGEGEGQYAASYWRYNTQLGGAALVFGAAGLGMISRRLDLDLSEIRGWRALTVVSAISMPLVFAPKIRFDLNPVTRYMRDVGAEMAVLVQPRGARITVVDPDDNGKRALILRYETAGRVRIERPVGARFNNHEETRAFFSRLETPYAWIAVATPLLMKAMGLELEPAASHLVMRGGDGWRLVRSWPYRGFDDPVASDD